MTLTSPPKTIGLPDDLIDSLHELLQAVIDSQRGFQEVIIDVTDPPLLVTLREQASDRRAMVGELQGLLAANGEEFSDDGSWLAAYHRIWIAVKAQVTLGASDALLHEIRRGEAYLLAKYQRTLAEAPESAVRSLLVDHIDRITRSMQNLAVETTSAEG